MPWILFIVAAALLVLTFLPADWVLTWTDDAPDPVAQFVVLVCGVAGALALLHALVALQVYRSSGSTLPAEDGLSRQVGELALMRTGAGVLVATVVVALLVAGEFRQAKVTDVLSDVGTVGAVFGLLSCAPQYMRITFLSMRRLLRRRHRNWIRAHTILAVIDTYVIYKFSQVLG